MEVRSEGLPLRAMFGVSIALLLSPGGATQAWAHTAHAGQPNTSTVRGLVIQVGSKLTVQTHVGAVNVPLRDNTRFVLQISGTIADIRKGQYVQVRPKNTGDAQFVLIDLTTRPYTSKTSRTQRSGGSAGTHAHHSWSRGRVAFVSDKSLKIKDQLGRTRSYALGAFTSVTKVMAAQADSLAIGQTVVVYRNAYGQATFVRILNA